MGMAHHHAGHSHGSDNERRVLWALLLTDSFMMAAVVGGLISGSLALLAAAVPMLHDAVARASAWVAVRISSLPADAKRPVVYQRGQVLAASVIRAVNHVVVAGSDVGAGKAGI